MSELEVIAISVARVDAAHLGRPLERWLFEARIPGWSMRAHTIASTIVAVACREIERHEIGRSLVNSEAWAGVPQVHQLTPPTWQDHMELAVRCTAPRPWPELLTAFSQGAARGSVGPESAITHRIRVTYTEDARRAIDELHAQGRT